MPFYGMIQLSKRGRLWLALKLKMNSRKIQTGLAPLNIKMVIRYMCLQRDFYDAGKYCIKFSWRSYGTTG
jgi:hypothetical protein